MPGGGSGGGGGRPVCVASARVNVSSTSASRGAPPPNHAQTQSGGGSGSGRGGGVGSAIAQGLGVGTGDAVAHRVVDGIFGPRTIKTETVATGSPASAGVVGPAVLSANSLGRDACNVPAKAFLDCLNSINGNEINKCQFYMDKLTECRRNSGATLSA